MICALERHFIAINNDPQKTLSVRLFGTFEAQRGGVPLPRTRSRKEQWLLAYLILHHPRAQDRHHLAAMFWPDSSDEAALANLRRSLKDLRRVLGGDAYRITSPDPRSLGVDLVGVSVDLLDFDAAAGRTDSGALEHALAIYRGPLLEGCSEPWVYAEREAREDACTGGLERLALEALAQGEPGAAVRFLHRAVGRDPLRESAHRALMRAFAASGDLAAVDRQYRDLRLYLRREINADPSEETAGLYRDLRTAGRARVSSSAGDDSAPSRRLPCPLTRLIGRESDIEQVASRLRRNRLVTLTGSGGVGKTRLAIAIAEQTSQDYSDGVWFVDLAPLTDPSLASQAVASSLGIREEPARPLAETLQRYLRQKSLLVVLDNCEHIITACAHLSEMLLEAGPAVRIVATSREALCVVGEIVWRVPSLAIPHDAARCGIAAETASVLLSSASVQLFADRASLANPRFQVTADNLPAIAEICRRLDGLPLAIELAAARVKLLAIEDIAARLENRFRLLAGGSRTALPRQQTLRALLDWSYDLLTEAEKRLLERLSVFAGSWDVEAAEQVCSCGDIREADILDLMSRVVDKSLVVADLAGAAGRCRLLETVREYGRDRLAERGETTLVRDRHRNYYLALAEHAERLLVGPEQARWLAKLELEHDNLRVALDWCQANFAVKEGLRLAGALYRFWFISGNYREVLDRLSVLLSQSDAREPTEARAKTLKAAAIAAHCLDDADTACQFLQEAVVIRRILGDIRETASDLSNLAIVVKARGDSVAARSLAEEALDIMRALGDDDRIANVLHCLGYTILSLGDCRSARRYTEEALTLSRQHCNTRSISAALDNLGDIARTEGAYVEAHAHYAEGIKLARELGDRHLVAQILEGFARLAIAQQTAARAARLMAAQDVLRQSLGAPIPRDERQAHERTLEATRSALGEDAFAMTWTEGHALTLDQTIEYALQEDRAG